MEEKRTYLPTADDRRVFDQYRKRPGKENVTIEEFMELRGPATEKYSTKPIPMTKTPAGVYVQASAITSEEAWSLNAEAVRIHS